MHNFLFRYEAQNSKLSSDVSLHHRILMFRSPKQTKQKLFFYNIKLDVPINLFSHKSKIKREKYLKVVLFLKTFASVEIIFAGDKKKFTVGAIKI